MTVTEHARAETHSMVDEGSSTTVDSSAKLKLLEDNLVQKYIDLLVKKIKSLEDELQRGARMSRSRERRISRSPSPDQTKVIELPSDVEASGRVVYEDVNFNDETRQWEATRVEVEPSADESKTTKDASHAFVWKIMHSQHNPDHKYSAVEVTGSSLENLLRTELNDYPGHFGDDRLFFDHIFIKIIYNWGRLSEIAEHGLGYSAEVVEDLNLLLNHVKRSFELKEYFEKREINRRNRVVAFDHLWTLFPPGELVYAEPFGQPQLFVVRAIDDRSVYDHCFFVVDCWSYGMLRPIRPPRSKLKLPYRL